MDILRHLSSDWKPKIICLKLFMRLLIIPVREKNDNKTLPFHLTYGSGAGILVLEGNMQTIEFSPCHSCGSSAVKYIASEVIYKTPHNQQTM